VLDRSISDDLDHVNPETALLIQWFHFILHFPPREPTFKRMTDYGRLGLCQQKQANLFLGSDHFTEMKTIMDNRHTAKRSQTHETIEVAC
jgi:hypothetical protein